MSAVAAFTSVRDMIEVTITTGAGATKRLMAPAEIAV
jgi:hypothetical protein